MYSVAVFSSNILTIRILLVRTGPHEGDRYLSALKIPHCGPAANPSSGEMLNEPKARAQHDLVAVAKLNTLYDAQPRLL